MLAMVPTSLSDPSLDIAHCAALLLRNNCTYVEKLILPATIIQPSEFDTTDHMRTSHLIMYKIYVIQTRNFV